MLCRCLCVNRGDTKQRSTTATHRDKPWSQPWNQGIWPTLNEYISLGHKLIINFLFLGQLCTKTGGLELAFHYETLSHQLSNLTSNDLESRPGHWLREFNRTLNIISVHCFGKFQLRRLIICLNITNVKTCHRPHTNESVMFNISTVAQ